MWRLPIWTLLALHRIHSAGAQGRVWATPRGTGEGVGVGGKGVPSKTPRLTQAEPSPGSLNVLPFFDFWCSLWGGAVSPRLLAFLVGDDEVAREVEKHLMCGRWAFVGAL